MRAYMYILNTMSDWEWGFITAELNTGRFFRNHGTNVPVTAIANTLDPVRTMGNIAVVPDQRLDATVFNDDDILILPGAETWLTPEHDPVLAMTDKLLARGVTVAAICGASEALANKGMLNERKHTSNGLSHLEQICPRYKGRNHYINEPAVTDGNLITASGAAPIDFTYHILKKLGVYKPETADAWKTLFLNRTEEAFYALFNTLQ